jgi:hypothetical protein
MEEKKLKELFDSMSRKEKIGQLFQVMGHMLSDEAILTGPLYDLGLRDEDIKLAGSVVGLGSTGAKTLIEIQKEHLKRHPHQIPLIFMMDLIHGYKTIYPMPIALGATFSPETVLECSKVSAREGAVSGVHAALSPMCDLARDARWGRLMESTGEDVYLNSIMSKATVEGYQQGDVSRNDTMAACVKHFAAYGGAEAGRDYNTVELSERTLRDFYLPAYKAAVDAGCKLVMTAYNTVDGIPATINKKLFRDILRGEWKYENVVVSDFAAIAETVMHGVAEDAKDAAKKALEAGCDIDMMGGNYSRFLDELIENGEVDEALLNESVMRILKLKNELGLFENPFKGADIEKEKEICLCEEHKQIAKDAAIKSFVLLKNEEDILPIKKEKKIACIGPYVDRKYMISSWAITGEVKDVVTVKEEAESNLKDYKLFFENGCPILPEGTRMDGFTQMEVLTYDEKEIEENRKNALKLAAECDTVLLFMGEHYLQSGEACSRTNLEIPITQLKLLDEIYEVNKNIALILFTGRPLVLTEVEKKVKAILNVWIPGTMAAKAIWEVVTGKSEPSGRLPMSFPYNVGQLPIHYDELPTGRPFSEENRDDRFQSKYLDAQNKPFYVFGYGLNYTKFEVSDIALSADKLSKDEPITASVTVKNVGTRKGTDTIQLYIHDISASVSRPVKQLKGFERVELEPNESREVKFTITEEMLRFTTVRDVFESEKGTFELFIGENSDTKNMVKFSLI